MINFCEVAQKEAPFEQPHKFKIQSPRNHLKCTKSIHLFKKIIINHLNKK